MGKFYKVEKDGIKKYTLFSKTTIKKVLQLDNVLSLYTFIPESKSVVRDIFLDSPKNLLKSAGILLSKSTENNKAKFVVERERYQSNQKNNVPQREEKVYVHEVGVRDSVKDHMFFLNDGIRQMFTTQFSIDLDNVLKTVEPKLEINSKKTTYKVFSGRGFKGEMIFEEVAIKNFETKRSASVVLMTIKQVSAKFDNKDFEDLTSKIEAYCREVMPINDNKYQIASRMTK